ncbi:LysE family translocator [Aeromicrobium fastidiosum]|uniref:LysE family translocator n=1 Tax=Aeromicrobium fastidiosum TaxID=52699 RepID=A0A641AM53_9ACTN|nr:LysE family translocator [Aeromicrobium fastidiosum]KAA1378209.1 LysE family translocator [Aeromicrobium fastidiosum]MBP2388982.1 threonine/homoserine/homoserine lactone efflux protein [Aeromicrobium fastidiosum]
MLPADHAAAFALAALALIVIPGPSVLFVIGRSLSLGRMGGFLSVLGNALGMVPAIVAVSVGIGALVSRSLVVLLIVKLVGAVYLVFLGVQAIRHRHDHVGADVGQSATRPTSARLVLEGFVVGVTNPKTIVFFVAVLPQFVSHESGGVPLQLALLGGIFFVIALACDSVWALAAGTARQWFARDPRRLARAGAGGGVMMIGLGGALAVTGSKQ